MHDAHSRVLVVATAEACHDTYRGPGLGAGLSGSLPVVTASTNEEVVPFWQVSVSGVRVERVPDDDWLVPGHAVLNITVRRWLGGGGCYGLVLGPASCFSLAVRRPRWCSHALQVPAGVTAQLYAAPAGAVRCAHTCATAHTRRCRVVCMCSLPESGAFASRATTELSRVVNVGAYVLASEPDSVFFSIIGPTGVTVRPV